MRTGRSGYLSVAASWAKPEGTKVARKGLPILVALGVVLPAGAFPAAVPPDWVLLTPELGAGGRPGVRIAVDTRTGERFEFKIDEQGRAVAP